MNFENNSDVNSSRLALASTWNPRGELSRFERLLPILKNIYDHMVISFPPSAEPSITEIFTHEKYASDPLLTVVVNKEWSWGRYNALRLALDTAVDFIQYGDMDRMLRWVETEQDEWRNIALKIMESDCLIIGRTKSAYSTHPSAIIRTEMISNRVVSFFLKEDMDVSAGSKGFSRRAVEFIIAHCSPGHALGTDAEWPIVLSRAGFKIDYQAADGLTWESADRYQDRAASESQQIQAADDYDSDPGSWEYRVGVADEIVQMAIESSMRSFDRKVGT